MAALSAMLAARPEKALALPSGFAQALSNVTPSDSSSSGFVTSDSQQTNTALPVTSTLTNTFDTSTISNNGVLESPSTATVLGGTEGAYATGNAATNTVDLANIGATISSNGLSVLADQANSYTTTEVSTPTRINSTLSNSGFINLADNAASGDSLALLSNLVSALTTGNSESSSVNGVVPVTYDSAAAGRVYLQDNLGNATGNVVVSSNQTNDGVQADGGSYATLNEYRDGFTTALNVDNTTNTTENLGLSLAETGNTMSASFLGNTANNGIGVAFTSGTVTGAPIFYGSLVESNAQANFYTGSFNTNTGVGALNEAATITTQVYTATDATGDILLADGSSTLNNNVISAAAVGNSAIGAAGGTAPGNEISLGVSLIGATTDNGNLINPLDNGGTIVTMGNLALSNLQNNNSLGLSAIVEGPRIYTYVQGLSGSALGAANNAITSTAFGSQASNQIDTSAGINLISGIAALTSLQDGYGASTAKAKADQSYAGEQVGYAPQGDLLDVTNATVTVADNSQAATAGVNLVTNAISLSSSHITAGPLGADAGPGTVTVASAGISQADAGVSLNNAQFTQDGAGSGAYLSSAFTGAQFGASAVSNSSVIVTNSTLAATDTNNNATDTVSLDGSQAITGSAGIANDQLNDGAAAALVAPESYRFGGLAGIQILAYGTDGTGVTDGTATLAGSSVSASAADNFVNNFLTATGGQIANDYVGTLGLSAQVSTFASQATVDLAVNNLQQDAGGTALAENLFSGDAININSDGSTISGSAFTVSGPAVAAAEESTAIGNAAANEVSASASTVLADTAGLVNAQNGGTSGDASAGFSQIGIIANGSNTYLGATENNGGNISDSSFTVGTGAAGGSDGNLVRALAYANQASNMLSISAGTLAPADTVFAIDGANVPESPPFDTVLGDGTGVGAAYGLLNTQVQTGSITAGLGYLSTFIEIGNGTTNPSLTDVTASVAGNADAAGVYGNQASNAGTIAAGNLSAASYYPIGDVTSLQDSAGTLRSTITLAAGGLFMTDIAGDGAVNESTLGVTNNTALSQAEGNLATNSLQATGGNIVDVSDSTLPALSSSLEQATSAQAGLAFTVLNDQFGSGVIGVAQAAVDALVHTGGTIGISTLTVDNNLFEAIGYQNNATSSLGLGGTSSVLDTLDTSAGVQNVQLSDGALSVTLGVPGTLAANPVPAVVAAPSAMITVAGSIAASTLDVLGNAFDALGIADNAVNTESIAATSLNGGAGISGGDANATVEFNDVYAKADYALANAQTVTAPVSAAGYGEAGINPTNLSAITSSTLDVSSNTLLAKAEGAVAVNTLSLVATNAVSGDGTVAPTAALVSAQESQANITASSGTFGVTLTPGLIITAPSAMTDSALTMDNNSSEVLAIAGSVVNLLSVSATNLGTADAPASNAYASAADTTESYADYSLSNSQYANGYAVTATGVSDVVNSDAASLTTMGLVSSSADLSGNTTAVYAETNTATNVLDMSAANSTALGALTNNQYSADTISASGAAKVQFSLNGSTDPDPAAAADSAINISNNSLEVQGIGNQATNALNADTGATYGTQDSASTGANAQATYAVLNAQDNAAGVSAAVPQGAVYGVALNGGGSLAPVANTTVTVSYNLVYAKAFANSAANSMVVSTLNSGNATAAEQNTQTNGAAVAASVTGASFGSAIGGPGASDTTVLVDNNSVVASGIGNVATNSIAH